MTLQIALAAIAALPDQTDSGPATDGARPRLDMNGTWAFRMDPEDRGVEERWFERDVDYPDEIQVPGNWQAQGFGPSVRHLRHDYQGKAWYRRVVNVPQQWSGQRVVLHLGGVTNTAEVYVNSEKVGSTDGFLTPFEFDVTDAVTPGADNVIACRVDSTGPAPVGMFNFIGRWGGLYRPVHMEARSDPAIDDLFVMPDVKTCTAPTQVVLRRSSAGAPWTGEVTVRITPATGGATYEGRASAGLLATDVTSGPIILEVPIDDMHAWTPEDPFLYSVEAVLTQGGRPIDTVRDRFGMRQFEIGDGGVLLLNGNPYFMRGIGDDTFEVITGTLAADKQVYIDRFNDCKRYGFNGARYLGHTPAKEVFEAADEVGFLIMCEGEVYWKIKEVIPLLRRQVTQIAKAYRNHPSWFVWTSGNEFFECEGPEPDPEWMAYILYAHDTFRELDPTRFFVASDGADVFPTDIITQANKFRPQPTLRYHFSGLIDEVAYYKRALTDAELASLALRDAEYPTRVQSLEPSGYWRLDEAAPGQAADSSGNGNHGVYDDTVTVGDLGRQGALEPWEHGGCVHVDRRSHGVRLMDVAAPTFAAGNEPFSVSLWIHPDDLRKNDFGIPFFCGTATNHSAFMIAEDGQDGTGKVRLGRYWHDFLISDGTLQVRQWNHIAVTYDGTTATLYLNGDRDKSVDVALTTVVSNGQIGGVPAETARDERYDSLPHIWHEFPNRYIATLPDLAIDEKWTGVVQDYNCISLHRDQAAALGVVDRWPEIRQRSIDLYYMFLKQNFEDARAHDSMDGFAFWLLTDVPGGPEGDMNFLGIFSSVYEPEKYPDPAPILDFNSETVLLMDVDADQRVLSSGETKEVILSISHYGLDPIRDGRVLWQITAGADVLQSGSIGSVAAETGEVKEIGSVAMGPFQPDTSQRLQLHVTLESDACHQENRWDFWVFPTPEPRTAADKIANLTDLDRLSEWLGVSPEVPLSQARVAASSYLTPDVIDYVESGGTLLLLAERDVLARPRPFSFWAEWIRSNGTLIERHPAMGTFAHDGFCGYQFYRLIDDVAEALDLTESGAVERDKLVPIVSGVTMDYDPAIGLPWSHPDNRWKMYRHGFICEGRIGEGKILVCSFRILAGLRHGFPEAHCLLDGLVTHALSDSFSPTSSPWTREEIAQAFFVVEP